LVTDGCWRNWVNGIGTPCEPPSNTGVMNVVIGNSGTVAPVSAARVTGRFIRTNRRSAETTAWMPIVKFVSGPGRNALFGMNTICPFTQTTVTSVTKKLHEGTVEGDVRPMKNI